MNENVEGEILRVISSRIYEPEAYKIAIENALFTDEKKLNNTHFYKMIAAICFSLIIISSIVYASYTIIQNVFNKRKGVETAINNNYIIDGLQEYHESNGVSVKINNMLIDDYNLDISFNLKFDDEEKIKDVKSIEFEKMIIVDEKNRILAYVGEQKLIEDFVKYNNLNIKIEEFNKDYINRGASAEIRNLENDQLDLIYNLSSYENKFPKSKEIVIYVENIIINDNFTLNGKWQIKQKMEDKFFDREKITYHCKEKIEEDIISIDAKTYATGTNISIEMKLDEENYEHEIEKILDEIEKNNKNEKVNSSLGENNNSLRNKLLNQTDNVYDLFNDVYIQNSNGIKFNITKSFTENRKELKSEVQDKITYYDILDMTIYDCTDEITLHFIYNGKEYNIKLIS